MIWCWRCEALRRSREYRILMDGLRLLDGDHPTEERFAYVEHRPCGRRFLVVSDAAMLRAS